jgi:hypothetical protein
VTKRISPAKARKLRNILADVASVESATEAQVKAMRKGRVGHCTFCDLERLRAVGLLEAADAEINPQYSGKLPMRYRATDLGRVALAWS